MKLFTAKDLKKLPPIGATAEERDPMVWVKLFHPRRGTWLLTEYDGKNEAFGYVMGLGGDELGYIPINELKRIGVERDMHFKPMKLSKAKAAQKKLHGEQSETMSNLLERLEDNHTHDDDGAWMGTLIEGRDIMSDYLKGKLSVEDLIKKAGGLDKVATKREMEGFLRNKFMIGWKVDETGIPEKQVVSKVKELLKRY